MHTADYQRFADALGDPEAALPQDLHSPAGTNLADRFAVYRNNVHVSLVDSLAAGFPVTRAHVGDEFFQAMARAFVQQCKPSTALLTFYGEDFPDFITGFTPASSLPWLPDLARLEHAWSECWAAPDQPPLPVTALREWRPELLLHACVYVHPAARLIRSAWPVADLWNAHQRPQPDLSTLDWSRQQVLLCRPHAEVILRNITADAADFIGALIAGDTIDCAAQCAPGIDAGAVLHGLFEDGFITGLRT